MEKVNTSRIFSEDIKINKYKLEDECERHPGMYHYWADLLADAKIDLDRAKTKMDLVTAKQDLYIRKNWDEANGKQTESGVRSVLALDDKIILAQDGLGKAQASVYTLQAAVSSLEHRKAELDNLVTLLVKGFYSSPNGGKREGPNEIAGNDIRKKLRKEE